MATLVNSTDKKVEKVILDKISVKYGGRKIVT